tara:strand:- start:263 stop:547 length:285 start_codon:yes stop_codon:yes gene_type:complete
VRAHATAVRSIQLFCEDLLNVGVLSADGLDLIKEAICSELAIGRRARVSDQREFDDIPRRRIHAVFHISPGEPPRDNPCTLDDFEDALGEYHAA